MLSQRTKQIEESATLAMAQKARQLIEQGIDVISLTLGEPDFPTPKHVKQAAIQAIEAGLSDHYTNATGIMPLKQAIIDFHQTFDDVSYSVKDVVVGTGAKHILYVLFQTIIEKGDDVLIPTPYWVSYSEQVRLAGGQCLFVKTTIDTDYKVSVKQLDEAYTSNTKALILNSPTNPTGSVYSKEELQEIGEWAVKHNVLIIADEIYYRLVYGNTQSICIASLSERIQQNTVIINGLAKSFAMTGWRVGYALSKREDIIYGMSQIISHETSNLTAVSQYAALEALSGTQQVVEEMRRAFEQRLNIFYDKIKTIPGFELAKPKGAFYLFPNIKNTLELTGYTSVNKFVEDLLEEAHVAVVSGDAFGDDECIRMSYAGDIERLLEAASRIRAFVEEKISQRES
nr:pyridoxal phosphate-dependent aminotransferase [Granulicatella sp. 19428wC4_WM01]